MSIIQADFESRLEKKEKTKKKETKINNYWKIKNKNKIIVGK